MYLSLWFPAPARVCHPNGWATLNGYLISPAVDLQCQSAGSLLPGTNYLHMHACISTLWSFLLILSPLSWHFLSQEGNRSFPFYSFADVSKAGLHLCTGWHKAWWKADSSVGLWPSAKQSVGDPACFHLQDLLHLPPQLARFSLFAVHVWTHGMTAVLYTWSFAHVSEMNSS